MLCYVLSHNFTMLAHRARISECQSAKLIYNDLLTISMNQESSHFNTIFRSDRISRLVEVGLPIAIHSETALSFI